MPHTLPTPDDRRPVPPHPEGRPWRLSDLTEDLPLAPALAWNEQGVVHLPGLIPDETIQRYQNEWVENNGPVHWHPDGSFDARKIGGYNETGYLRQPVLMEICTNAILASYWYNLLGEHAGVHLNLTGWTSTQRNWHSDYYLNESCVGDYYGAIWVALDDVEPDSGPFEYYPGSHLWDGVVTKAKIGQVVDLSDPRWPAHSEDVLESLVEAEAARRGVQKVVHLPKRGDVLMWHGRLYHRGSRATREGAYRGALIAHFSGLNHRTDMPRGTQHPRHGGWFFQLGPVGEGVL